MSKQSKTPHGPKITDDKTVTIFIYNFKPINDSTAFNSINKASPKPLLKSKPLINPLLLKRKIRTVNI